MSAGDAAEPKLGERDAGIVRSRFALEDLGFEVFVIDASDDLAGQVEDRLEEVGPLEQLVIYASCLLAVVDDDQCFLCLNPDEPDVGDSLPDVLSVVQGRAEQILLVADLRLDDPEANRSALGDAMAALDAAVSPSDTGVELIASIRPLDAHPERIPSRLTASLLEAIDDTEGPVLARRLYARAIQAGDFGEWPHVLT
ncbi:MAG: hypothetical protein KC731_40875, partial [Myxococcales bacterium]|nr:hypothetical protein [Myxococcales bacterium]